MSGRQANGTERPAALARRDRSQSPHSTAAARAARSAESKAAPREGGQEGGSGKDGKTRPLGIPTVKDRIVQTAVKFVLEPVFEATFHPTSYGFRPGRGCHDALREVAGLIEEGHTFAVDADFASYFDTIPHERLMQ